MKKYLAWIAIAVLLCSAGVALAGADSKLYALESVGLVTNAKTYVIRGEIEAVYIDVDTATTRTNMVYVTDPFGVVIFSNATLTADAKYYPRKQGQTTAGAALSWTEAGTQTNTVTTTYFAERFAVAGEVTATYVNVGTSTTQTNGADVTVIYVD